MDEEAKKKHIKNLWNKARRYNNKLRFQARLQKMTESNLKEMMIDDLNEEQEEEGTQQDTQPKLKWYLIDTDRTFCKVWNFLITILTIYTLFVVPYIVVFKVVYEWCELDTDGTISEDTANCPPENIKKDETLFKIELALDIIYFIEILLNFVKKTRAHKELKAIAQNYIGGYFVFDVVATIPCLFMSEPGNYYLLKIFRIVHVTRLTQPLQLLLGVALQKYSKKRQNDLSSFAGLIFYVIYVSHLMACLWLWIGQQQNCEESQDEHCTKSWVYENDFFDKPKHT